MQTPVEFWEKKHRTVSGQRDRPHGLAVELDKRLTTGSSILELGCGDGGDALYLAESGHRVIACDFSDTALSQFAQAALRLRVEQRRFDLSSLPYSFAGSSFDAVYARLSLHYFSQALTRDIFAEIARVLRPGAFFFGLFNSHFDAENGTGTRVEDRYYELALGCRKRFFTTDETADILGHKFHQIDSRYVMAGTERPERRLVQVYAERLS